MPDRVSGDWQVGEDLVQEALTRTYLRRRTLRSVEALEPYSRKVLITLFLSSRRRLWHRELPFASVPEKSSGRYGAGITRAEMRRCHWVEPTLVCQIKFSEWTRDGKLRQPVFLGLREDKDPKEVVRERPA